MLALRFEKTGYKKLWWHMPDNESTNPKPNKTQVLLDNYRESRQEGLKLVHSVFNDIAFSVALLGAIFTGGVVTDEPRLQLVIPFLLGGIAIYGVQKLRVSNLITCYMIYLEKEINRDYSMPIMIWNSEFIRRNVSAGRQNRWGEALLFFAMIVIGILYGGICYWSIIQNDLLFDASIFALYLYVAGCILVFVFNVLGIVAALSVTKKYTPEFMEKAIQAKEIEFVGSTPKIIKKRKTV